MHLQTSVNHTTRVEPYLRLFFGLLLWGASATLTISLFLALSDGSLGQNLLLVTIAVGLEGSKILTWRSGGKARIFAVALICLSGIASLGASLQVVENSKNSFFSTSQAEIKTSPSYIAKTTELESLDTEIAALVERIKILPADYSTATTRLTVSLQSLRDRRQSLVQSISAMETSAGSSSSSKNMFVLLGKAVGLRPEIVMLILLICLSASIEIGALILTVPNSEEERPPKSAMEPSDMVQARITTAPDTSTVLCPSYTSPIGTEEFLQAAQRGADLPYLHGRDITAHVLGITCAEAKRLVTRLIADKKIVVEGKRLRLI
jgi:hypothetical protein